ncbi:hypothetical protein PLUA15_150045 [Pseudomonas lundensis]|uniref:Uncharacterized protein n=1 Tax=Pseudomonas lundensis TaxID=86185 RepID=A0AAX2H3F3_9PSED|nr:hypothetical protein PLUA15_150045 [Pseudomonas lundensis]
MLIAALRAIHVLPWAYQLHVVIQRAQSFIQMAKGMGHAVDFGWEGFSDEGDAKGSGHDSSVGRSHDVDVSR